MRKTLPACLAVVLLTAASTAQDRSVEEAAEADRLCTAELPRWRLTVGEQVLENPSAPVLRWTNPGAGRVYGNTYVWLLDGRPAAAGCMYRYFDPFRSFNGELTALAAAGLSARRDDKLVWQPAGAWQWHDFPDAPKPAASAPLRLLQMKTLAEGFTPELRDTRNVLRPSDQTPRLLSRPLVRYDPAKARSLDGALFAFVLGTDPELLLQIECDLAASRPRWRFGVGRMNRDAFRLVRKGETVWEARPLRTHRVEDSYRFLEFGLPREEPKP